MNKFLIAAAALIAAAPTAAQGPVELPPFDSVSLRGGGKVILRHGPQQRVTLIKGSRDMTRFAVDRDGRLRILACVRSCSNYDVEIEIVSPGLEGIAIENGGMIRAEGRFPERRQLAVAIEKGGLIDVLPMASGSVAASISKGGLIRTHARSTLTASIDGGGGIRYRGAPAVSAVDGGGAVSPLRD